MDTRERLTVGRLAERAGITVRTLHHYDDLGLLEPADRTDSGYRLYGRAEVGRLQQILSLRRLGLRLEEIRELLDDPAYSAGEVLSLQIEQLGRRIEEARRLRDRLERIRSHLREMGRAPADELLNATRATAMFDRYYTPEQLRKLARRREVVGPDVEDEAGGRWADLLGRFGEAMAAGRDSSDPDVLEMAREARELIRAFTGDDPGIRRSLETMYREEGPDRVLGAAGIEVPEGLWSYMQQARRALEEADATAPGT